MGTVGPAWGRTHGVGFKMREALNEDLESKAGSANIVWKEGVDLEVRDECDEVRVVFTLNDEFNYGLSEDNYLFQFGRVESEKPWKGNVWEMTFGMAIGGKTVWGKEVSGKSYNVGSARFVEFMKDGDKWTVISCDTLGLGPKWKLLRTNLWMGEDSTEYDIPQGGKWTEYGDCCAGRMTIRQCSMHMGMRRPRM